VTRLLGVRAAQTVFDLVRPAAFAQHAFPLNRVRRRHGLPGLGWGLLQTYTDADFTLYADLPDLIPSRARRPRTVTSAGAVVLPAPLQRGGGSANGPAGGLRHARQLRRRPSAARVLAALADLPVTVIASTAGRVEVPDPPANCRLADYSPGPGVRAGRARDLQRREPHRLPGPRSGRAGSRIASNMDQLMNMTYVENAGAGLWLRASEVTTGRLIAAAKDCAGQTARREPHAIFPLRSGMRPDPQAGHGARRQPPPPLPEHIIEKGVRRPLLSYVT